MKNGRNLVNLSRGSPVPCRGDPSRRGVLRSHAAGRCVKSAHARCPLFLPPWPAEPGRHRCAPAGKRRRVLYGRTATARRTGAASLLATQRLAQVPQEPLLIVGAGCRAWRTLRPSSTDSACGRVWVASRSSASAEAFAAQMQALDAQARVGCGHRNATPKHPPGPVLFKSCGWAGGDLAAARLALRHSRPASAAMASVTATPA